VGFKKKLVTQVRNPRGTFGRIVAKMMNKGHAKLTKWGFSQIKIDPNYTILDIGCGGGGNVRRLAEMIEEGKVYGVDCSETSISISRDVNKDYIDNGTVELYSASVMSLPFDNDVFDIISGVETCYFWPDFSQALKEIYRVLKPNGKLILINEGYLCENEKKRKQAEKWSKLGNFPLYSPEEYEAFLKKSRFSKIQIYEERRKGWIAVIGGK
jgi:ubiquinone/menaquinone biosynthesis C-methylase UbiE